MNVNNSPYERKPNASGKERLVIKKKIIYKLQNLLLRNKFHEKNFRKSKILKDLKPCTSGKEWRGWG